MSARVNGANRAALALLGLLLLLAGVAGLALSVGIRSVSSYQLSTPRPGQPLIPKQLSSFAAANTWFWWAVAAAALLLALLGLRWLLAQLRTDRISRFDLTANQQDGSTVVHAGALTDAVAADAATIPGVDNASAQLISHPTRRLVLAVNLTDYADIAQVRDQLESLTVAHARQAVDQPDLPIDIRLRPATTTRRAPN